MSWRGKLGSRYEGTSPRASKSDFEMWYAQFPWKGGKGQARKSYAAARMRSSPAIILSGMLRYREHTESAPAKDVTIISAAQWLDTDGWVV